MDEGKHVDAKKRKLPSEGGFLFSKSFRRFRRKINMFILRKESFHSKENKLQSFFKSEESSWVSIKEVQEIFQMWRFLQLNINERRRRFLLEKVEKVKEINFSKSFHGKVEMFGPTSKGERYKLSRYLKGKVEAKVRRI